MSDDGERTCPLCAEEMDLTDQQLKPCKCGYEICVWCWHHIIDMAEKEDTEGRCPACRTPYDKERIVGTAANCERVVAEMNAEKRQKFQKAKPKPSAEARKHLSSVRVIQRNLVYIIGLPSNLCDENLLERKEYFGQYGKVLKVSLSRPTIATGHQTSNSNTFSVYITYTREEEAVRCIQAVHNFVLEGKPLRACFGTTKYCHAWLRNMTCSNPDCLYLHDIGTQEDSFTKDEIISAYTRCRVPQIALNNLQRRSGTVLPPPVDDLCNSGTASCKHAAKSAPNNATSQVKMLSHCSNDGKVTALPVAASWGLRVSNCRQPAASIACSQSVKQKGEAVSSSSMKLNSAWHDDVVATSRISEGRHSLYGDGNSRPVDAMKPSIGRDCRIALESPLDVGHTSETSAWDDDEVMTSKVPEESSPTPVGGNLKPLEPVERNIGQTAVSDMSSEAIMDAALIGEISTNSSSSSLAPATSDIDRGTTDARNSTILPEDINHEGFDVQSCDVAPVNIAHGNSNVDGNMEGLCLELSLVNLDNHLEVDRFKVDQHQSTLASHSSVSTLQQGVESSALSVKTSVMTDARVLGESYDCNSELQKQGLQSSGNKMEDRMLASDDQRQRLPDVTSQQVWATFSHEVSCSSASSSSTSWNNNFERMKPLLNEDSRSMTIEDDKHLLLGSQKKSILPNGHLGDKISFSSGSDVVSECSNMNYTKEKANYVGIFDSVSNINKTVNIDTGEHNIISDVLSLDFDPWDDSLSAANNFARLLGESGKRDGPFKQSGSWKSQTSTESRFSFARQESQANNLEPSIKDIGRVQNISSSPQDSLGDRYQNASFFHNLGGSIAPATNIFVSSDRTPGASKVKGSAPPGFSLPNRTPPPGFSSVDRYEQSYRTHSGENHLLGSFPLRNQQQMHVTENTGDVEFIDPAILAVGKGRLSIGVNNSGFGSASAFPAQFNSFDNDPRFQLLMQQSSSQQDLRLSDHLGDRLLPLNESHVSSRLLTQNSSNFSPFAQLSFQHPRNVQIPSSQWDSWNDVRTGNVIGMVENFRNDRFGLNNYFPGNEERKFCIPSPGNMYNRAFGM